MDSAEQEILDNSDYTHFVVDTSLCTIESGWSHKSDALEHISELKADWQNISDDDARHIRRHYRVWARSTTQRFFKNSSKAAQ